VHKKLKPNKRIRLTSDGNDYDLHVMADLLENNEEEIIVFFAVTDVEFGKTHSVAKLLEDFKSSFYSANDTESIRNAKEKGVVHKNSQMLLEALIKKYGQNKIAEVQARVDEVKNVMRENVEHTLENVQKLEELETKSETIQHSAKLFEKNASGLKSQMMWRYIKMTMLIVLLIGAILAIILIPIFAKR